MSAASVAVHLRCLWHRHICQYYLSSIGIRSYAWKDGSRVPPCRYPPLSREPLRHPDRFQRRRMSMSPPPDALAPTKAVTKRLQKPVRLADLQNPFQIQHADCDCVSPRGILRIFSGRI